MEFFGYIMRKSSMENLVTTGTVEGRHWRRSVTFHDIPNQNYSIKNGIAEDVEFMIAKFWRNMEPTNERTGYNK